MQHYPKLSVSLKQYLNVDNMIGKLVLVSALIAVASAQVLPLGLLRGYPGRAGILPAPVPLAAFRGIPAVRPYAAGLPYHAGAAIPILRLDSVAAPDGSQYQYAYETANGIAAQQVGQQIAPVPDAPLRVSGSYQYTSPEGVPVQVSYVADENGFHPTGNVIP